MKVLLYTENEKLVGKSGLGKAIKHQQKALEEIGVPYTLNVKDDYDILHVNTYFPKSYMLVKSEPELVVYDLEVLFRQFPKSRPVQ